MVLEKIDYKKIFYYFEIISAIPRGSKYNEQISEYLVNFAKERNLKYIQDEFRNVIIFKNASIGYEESPVVMIQGHMDMVCEKESDCNHDFQTQGLELQMDGDFIYAKGTTLGADDGIAVAYALALLDDNTVKHPALEVVITTDEEIGMDGAIGLNTSVLKASYMLNIDSDVEGVILASCAGGMTSVCTLTIEKTGKYSRIEKRGIELEILIYGLQGGHSGAEIGKNRSNATLLLGRLLNQLKVENNSFDIITMRGGLKDNAIPREAIAQILVHPESITSVKEKLKIIFKTIKDELKTSDPNVSLKIIEKNTGTYKVLTEELSKSILFMFQYTPNGVQTMSSDIDGLVESSLNLGIFAIEETGVIFSYSVRSSVGSYKRYLGEKLKQLIEHLHGSYSIKSEYPAWEYKKESKLRDIVYEVFEGQYGYSPKVEALHAGLECGIIAGKMPNIDIVSLGPNMYDIHTPKERLSVSSSIRVYDFIVKALEALRN